MKVLDGMRVPDHMEITASLLAGHRLDHGSLIEVDRAGDYRISDAADEVTAETVDTRPGEDMGIHAGQGGPPRAEDYGDILDDLAAFLMHDGDNYDASRSGDYQEAHDEFSFGINTAAWASAHYDELSILASYMEDKRLGEDG